MLKTKNMRKNVHWEKTSTFSLQHLQSMIWDFTQNFCFSNFLPFHSFNWNWRRSNILHCVLTSSWLFVSLFNISSSMVSNVSFFIGKCFTFLQSLLCSALRLRCSKYANSRIAHPTKNKQVRRYIESAESWFEEGESA